MALCNGIPFKFEKILPRAGLESGTARANDEIVTVRGSSKSHAND